MSDERPSVLVVDDEHLVARAVARALRLAMIDVQIADHPHAALEALEAQDFDLVLSDFDMPELNGVALLDEIRRRYPAIRRVLTSAAPPANLDTLLLSGDIEHFEAKPLCGDLALRLGTLLGPRALPLPRG